MDDILNDLIIADGMERPAKKKPAKKAKKKITKPARQPVAVEPTPTKPKYSVSDLNAKSTSELKAICSRLGIDGPRRKTDLIKNILDNT
tara:strand:- start:1398 stop:1664 length:267 start_codon:yes stop_codon:yes gene_type:complete